MYIIWIHACTAWCKHLYTHACIPLNLDRIFASSLFILFLSASLDLPIHGEWQPCDCQMTDTVKVEPTGSSYIYYCTPFPSMHICVYIYHYVRVRLCGCAEDATCSSQFLMSEMKTVKPRIASPNFAMMLSPHTAAAGWGGGDRDIQWNLSTDTIS